MAGSAAQERFKLRAGLQKEITKTSDEQTCDAYPKWSKGLSKLHAKKNQFEKRNAQASQEPTEALPISKPEEHDLAHHRRNTADNQKNIADDTHVRDDAEENWLMRNNSVECVNAARGHSFVECQRSFGFMGVDFAANGGDRVQNCRT